MRNRLKDLQKHAKKYSFWSAVAAALAAFTIIYLVFRLTGMATDEQEKGK
jgi:hypothetical protein